MKNSNSKKHNSRKSRGRPRKYADAAERQRAYRQRLSARGLREIHRIARDVRPSCTLRSDVIDLSAVAANRTSRRMVLPRPKLPCVMQERREVTQRDLNDEAIEASFDIARISDK